MQSISIIQARKLVLAKQKLTCGSLSPQEIIEHLGYVQIDTISVIERAHHHVFWSRCAKYKPSDLDRLVKSRQVFEKNRTGNRTGTPIVFFGNRTGTPIVFFEKPHTTLIKNL